MGETLVSKPEIEQNRAFLLFQALAHFATRRATSVDLQKLEDAWNGVDAFPVVYNGELYDLQRGNIQLAYGCSDPQIIGVELVNDEGSVIHSPSRIFSKENQILILSPRLLIPGVQ